MKALIQRIEMAWVSAEKKIVAQIENGLLIFVGIEDLDNQYDINWLAAKIVNLRVFSDSNSVMNLSVKDIQGELLLVSQFTLHASTKKGNRPSYIKASKPEIAVLLYENFIEEIEKQFEKKIKTGIFGAEMKVGLINDGPVTIILDSKNKL